MREDLQFEIGAVYFLVTFVDSGLTMPVILSYRYLGRDLVEDDPAPQYYFRYLPAFTDPSDDRESAWSETFPDLFVGPGEPDPTSFSAEKARSLVDISGLIRDLEAIRQRQSAESL